QRGDVAWRATQQLPVGFDRRLVVPPPLELEGARHGGLLRDGGRHGGRKRQEYEYAGAEGGSHRLPRGGFRQKAEVIYHQPALLRRELLKLIPGGDPEPAVLPRQLLPEGGRQSHAVTRRSGALPLLALVFLGP